MPGTERLEIVTGDGGVTFQLNGITMLEGAHTGGGLEARFVPASGVRATFVLRCASDSQGYSLTGCGAISIHAMEFPSATVSASPRGILIESSAEWHEARRSLFVALEANSGLWHGSGSFEEVLQCSVTPRATIAIRLTIELGGDSRSVSADGSVEGIVDHVRVTPRPGESVHAVIAVARVLLLTALLRNVQARVELLESSFADWEPEREVPVSLPESPLPTVSPKAPSVRPGSFGNYLSARTQQPRSGYLARVQPAGPIRTPVGLTRGYLRDPAETAKRRGYLANEKPTALAAPNSDKSSTAWRSQPKLSPIGLLTDRETMAYAIIRFKDILNALALAAQEEQ